MGRGQLGLGLADLGQAEVVVAELAGHVGLVVAREERRALVTLVHSVNPLPHHSSFSGMGWNWGR